MILIADSGSTKTDWRLLGHKGEVQSFQTQGFNPYYDSESSIAKKLQAPEIETPKKHISQVFFYGAGCTAGEATEKMQQLFAKNFAKNTQIAIHDDILGAARALCQRKAGIACILGTGSNSCLYDGEKIIDRVPALGFILGDEGSGAVLGKKLLTAYFKRNMPPKLAKPFEEAYAPAMQTALNAVYKGKFPSRFLARFTFFLKENMRDDFVQKLIFETFAEFFDNNISKYENFSRLPVHFTGSVAFHFQRILHKVAEKKGFAMGTIADKPIDLLVNFHQKTS